MSHVAGVAVAEDVGDPFVARCVGVAGADVADLEGFEEGLGAEFVGLVFRVSARMKMCVKI